MKSVFVTATLAISKIIGILLTRSTALPNIITYSIMKLVYIINFQDSFARKVYEALLPIKQIAICTIVSLVIITGIIVPVSSAGEVIDVNDPSLPSQISQYVAENNGYVVKDGYNYFFFDETSRLLLFREHESSRGKVFVEYKQLTSDTNTLLPSKGIIRKIDNNNKYIESTIYFSSPEEMEEYGIIDEYGKIIKRNDRYNCMIFDNTGVAWMTNMNGYSRLLDQYLDPRNPDDENDILFLSLTEKPLYKKQSESESPDSRNEASPAEDDTNNNKSIPGFEIFGVIYLFIIFILKRKL